MSARRILAVAALGAVVLGNGRPAAQIELVPKVSSESLRRLVQEKRRALARAESHVEHLTNLLLHRHLGVTHDLEALVELTEDERARSTSELQHDLDAEAQAVTRDTRTLEQRSAELRQLRAALEQPAESTEDGPLWQAAPEPLPAPVPVATPRVAAPIEPEPIEPVDSSAAPEPGTPTLIRGSTDPRQVGRALFMARQYTKALAELERAIDAVEPALLDLFYLARCYEKSGNTTKAEGLYLQIEALDDKRQAGGRWASAARTARQHMNWMADHGVWKAPSMQPSTASESSSQRGKRP